jgi:glyoxylase-like metal-dependent hydrolase (beta-lactamase superfamily II)
VQLVEVAPHVHACVTEGRRLGQSNSGFVDRGGGLVVDTFWDLPHTRRLIDLYASVAPEPARRLVNTHHNGDHCWGNQLFADAEIWGHRECAVRMTREAPPQLLVDLCAMDAPPSSLAGFVDELRAFDFAGIEVTPPDHLIDGDTTLDLDGSVAELCYVGPAHTAGDVAVWLPDEGALFAGDVLFHQCTPVGWEGTFATWIAALERLEALGPAVVVPGHGPVCGVEGLTELRGYLIYVRAEAAVHHAAGRTTLEAAERIDLAPFEGWAEPERLAFQVHRAYRELDGLPWDTPLDAGTVFAETAALRRILQTRAAGA